MAEPIDSAVIQTLDLVDLNIERYWQGYAENSHVFDGSVTNRIFKPGLQKVTDDGINVKLEHWMADTVRPSASPLSDNRVIGAFQPREFKIRFNAATPASNDFTSFDAAVRVSHLELKRLTDANGIVAVAERLVRQVSTDYDVKKAVAAHTPKSSAIATINGNLIDGASLLEYTGSTYTASATTVRFKIDGGSIAALRNGTVLTITKSNGTGGVVAQINHINTVDSSIRVTAVSGGGNFGSSASAYDNGLIYFSSVTPSDNPGMYSIYEWFTTPTASETWLGGKDRTSVTDSYLNPLRYKAVSSGTTPISQVHLDTLAEAMQFQMPDDWTAVILGHNKLINSIRNTVASAAIVMDKPMKSDGYDFGSKSIGYQHANLGRVELLGEPLSHPNRLYFMVPKTWQRFHYGTSVALEPLSGDVGSTNWSRMLSSTPNAGKSKIYQAEYFQPGLCDVCLHPEMNGVILNVEP